MGLHICVNNSNGSSISKDEWDFVKQWYDEEFVSLFDEDIRTEDRRPASEAIYYGDASDFKVLNINVLRTKINNTNWEPEGKKRYLDLCDLLENNDYWLFFSY